MRPVGRIICSTTTPCDFASSYGPWRGRHVHHLPHPRLPLGKVQRTVVERGWQPEPVGDQHFLARPVAVIHAADLRHRLVALVHDQERVLGQVVQQRRRRLARRAPGQVPRVVLDAMAVANLVDHLEVEHRPLVDTLGLEQLPFGLEGRPVLDQFRLDGLDGSLRALARRHEVRLGENGHLVVPFQRLAGQRIERDQLFHLVAEQLNPDTQLFVRGIDVHDVAPHAEGPPAELVIVSLVLDLDELAEDLVAPDRLAALERQHHAVIRLGRPQTINARHTGDDDDVAPLEQRACGGQPHAVDLFVNRGLFFDVRVRRRHVGFRLVVVVVADEILDRVLREKPSELLKQLGGERFVVDHHQRRPVEPGDRLGHGEGLARPGDAKEHLVAVAAFEAFGQLADGALLVARKLEVRDESKAVVHRGHEPVIVP